MTEYFSFKYICTEVRPTEGKSSFYNITTFLSVLIYPSHRGYHHPLVGLQHMWSPNTQNIYSQNQTTLCTTVFCEFLQVFAYTNFKYQFYESGRSIICFGKILIFFFFFKLILTSGSIASKANNIHLFPLSIHRYLYIIHHCGFYILLVYKWTDLS